MLPRALVAAVLETRLGRELRDESFWESVLHFLIRCPELDLARVGRIVDYLHDRLASSQPELCMKGRTPASLWRLVSEWHRELGRSVAGGADWPRSRLREFAWTERVVFRQGDSVHAEDHAWEIHELCGVPALRDEGRAMRHCVLTYAEACIGRRTSIWSMRVETPNEFRRVLTIEVDMGRRPIVQARLAVHAPVGGGARALRRWAEQERLTMVESLRI